MKVTLKGHACTVVREDGDPHFRGIQNAAGESRLLYHVKRELTRQGYDIIKKRMWRDGHLMADMQQYLRTRCPSTSHCLMIYNPRWAIEGADETLNREGSVTLRVD